MNSKTVEYPFMYTGYYAKVNEYVKHALFPISISYNTPYHLRWIQSYKPLAPSRYLLNLYKEKCIEEDEYIIMYSTQLDDLDKETVIKDIFTISGGTSPILLCYEKSFDFCHRNLVSDWLNTSDLVSCMEYF